MSEEVLASHRGAADEAALQDFLVSAEKSVGRAHVLTGDQLDAYVDPYSFRGGATTRPGAAVLPASVGETQEVVLAAAAASVPLWTVSRGRNLGYGGASPRVSGSVILDLQRMDRVLEVNDDLGYAIVEPGVSFLELAEHLRGVGSSLLPSVPDVGWGSVLGNALERGFGYTAHGDHSAYVCGLEVVMADGSLLRTGMGALPGNTTWPLYKGGFGPSLDGLFLQSNMGIVTKMGIWLMPRPASFAVCMVTTRDDSDLGPLVDALRPLMLSGTIQSNVVIGNAPMIASLFTSRAAWWAGPGLLPDEAVNRIVDTMQIGRWNARFAFYGTEAMCETRVSEMRDALTAMPSAELRVTTYPGDVEPDQVQPADWPQLGIPTAEPSQVAAWRGGTPAHTDFALVCPPTSSDVVRQAQIIRSGLARRGFDYAGGFMLFPRHAIALAVVSFDRDNEAEAGEVAQLLPELIADAAAAGYASYRSHLAFMDLVADQYSANSGALRDTTRKIKDALDPLGVLAPGKQGIWPSPRH